MIMMNEEADFAATYLTSIYMKSYSVCSLGDDIVHKIIVP